MGDQSHPDHFRGDFFRFLRVARKLDSTSLASSARMHLRFKHNLGTDLICNLPGLGGVISHFSLRDLNSVLIEDLFGLILMNFHWFLSFIGVVQLSV